jgi:hypothetical protein
MEGMKVDGDSQQGDEAPFNRLIAGLHDVRLPVSNPWTSRNWYMSVFAFEPILDLQEAPGLVGVVLRHPSGIVIGLHQDAVRAAALRNFVIIALTVADRPSLQRCSALLDELGQVHTDIEQGHVGWYLDVPDPDGIFLRLHTATTVDAEEA